MPQVTLLWRCLPWSRVFCKPSAAGNCCCNNNCAKLMCLSFKKLFETIASLSESINKHPLNVSHCASSSLSLLSSLTTRSLIFLLGVGSTVFVGAKEMRFLTLYMYFSTRSHESQCTGHLQSSLG